MAYSADKTIDGLDALTSLDDTDVLVAGDQSDSDRAKKITKANFEADLDVTASQVSDFDTEVANNSAVTANTAKTGVTTEISNVVEDTTPQLGGDLDVNGNNITGLTASRAMQTNGSGVLEISAVTEAELNYLDGVTSAIQTQLDAKVADTGNETVAGVKTFSSSPVVPTPTTDMQASTKKYVDDNAGGAPEGTAVKSTGETGGSKFLREDGDNTCSWQAISGGGDALTSSPLSQFAATTSAQLAGVLSDETGSGLAVFGTSPTLVTPALGTPSALVGTNISGTAAGLTAGDVTTNANLTGPITSSGNATSIASQTGTGTKFVVDTSPTLVTPDIGTPSAGVLTNCSGTASSLTAGAVSTITGLAPDTATTQATQAAITTCANLTTVGTVTTGDVDAVVSDADLTTKGKVELATTAETNTGTDATRAVTPDALEGSKYGATSLVSSINFIIDGGGSAIETGVKGYIEIPFACTINQVSLLADQSGSIVVDINKSTYAGFPTTASICASALPTLSTAQKSQDSTLTGWTTSISAGDVLEYEVDSITTVERVTLALKITRT